MVTQTPDSIELFKVGLKDGINYLGTPSVVEKILRNTLNRVMDYRHKQLNGEAVDVSSVVDALAKAIQSVFDGKVDGFHPSPWHKPSAIGVALVERSKMGGSPEDAIYRLALRMIVEFLRAYSAFEDDKMEDAAFDAEVQRIVEFYTKILVGVSL
jgi:hypothetical protein